MANAKDLHAKGGPCRVCSRDPFGTARVELCDVNPEACLGAWRLQEERGCGRVEARLSA